MLIATNLRKVYVTKEPSGWFQRKLKEVEAVKNLTLDLKPGEIVGLLGMNGAGKTTTIKMLSTLLTPTSGTITIDGLDSVRDALKIKHIVNMIAGGERMLYARLTGRENLEYFGNLYGIFGQQLRQRIDYLLQEVGLTEAADTRVERYSKGMKQRLQIARGLINNPKYIFLDEPTLGLDAPVAKRLREYTRELAIQEQRAILLTSHYLSEVEELCDRVYIVDKGELVLQDTPENIIQNVTDGGTLSLLVPELSDDFQQRLTFLLQPFGATFTATGHSEGIELLVKSKQDVTAPVLQFVTEARLPVLNLTVTKPTLEDAILQLARRKSA